MDVLMPLPAGEDDLPASDDLIAIVRVNELQPIDLPNLLCRHSKIVFAVTVNIDDFTVDECFPKEARESLAQQVQLSLMVSHDFLVVDRGGDIRYHEVPAHRLVLRVERRTRTQPLPAILVVGAEHA